MHSPSAGCRGARGGGGAKEEEYSGWQSGDRVVGGAAPPRGSLSPGSEAEDVAFPPALSCMLNSHPLDFIYLNMSCSPYGSLRRRRLL